MAIIGIDLGTSNSAAAVLRGGRPVIIPSAEGISLGGKAFPSYVAITEGGQTLVGEPARRQATSNPEGTATGFKRKMGQREKIHLGGHDFTPEQLSAFLLQKIKRDAEPFLGKTVEKAVYNSAVLEELARMAFLTLQIRPDTPRLKEALINKHYERKHGANAYYGQ